MPYTNPNVALLGPWLIGWAVAWDIAALFLGPPPPAR